MLVLASQVEHAGQRPKMRKKEGEHLLIPRIPSIGGMEQLIVPAIILSFFGAKRVPELDKGLGRGLRECHQGTAEAGRHPSVE